VEDETSERLIAVARSVRVAPRSERAEFAITVADDHQNRGADTLLLERLTDLLHSFVARYQTLARQMS
jgi:hypothetical protein